MPEASTTTGPKPTRRQQLLLAKKLEELEAIEREIQRRKNSTNPMYYGLPDLLFPKGYKQGVLDHGTGEVSREPLDEDETDLEYIARQERAIKDLIETHLHFTKDGRIVNIYLIDKQVQFIADFFYGRSRRGILWKGRGCLTPEDLVISDRGLVPISTLTADDLVINRDGRLTEVVDVVPRKYQGKIVRLKINGNGQKLGFTPDHPVLGIRTSRCNQKEGNCGRTVCTNLCTRDCPNRFWESYREEWIEAGSLRKGDLVFVPSPVTDPEDRNVSFSGCANQHWSGSCSFPMNDDFFRLLGYWLAEGDAYVPGRRVRLAFESGKDDRFVADVIQIVETLMGLKAGIEEDGKKKSVVIHSAGLSKMLSSFGKSRGKGIPIQFLSKASDSQLRNLIVGMLRGDGHWDGTSIRASWCSPLIAADFMYACWRLGFTPSCRIVEGQNREGFLVNRSGKQFYLQIGGHPGRELAKLAWEIDAAPLQNDPMNTQRRWLREGKVFSRVDEAEIEDYDGEVWDVEVREGSSFCLPYLVAHNCGGSLCAAIMIWLIMIYKHMSFIDLGGSMEQSRVVYEYVSAFWDAVPGLSELLEKDPLISMTKLITGVQLKCIPASEKMARGKHLPGLVADEASIVPGTLIWTRRGVVPIEDVAVGDVVFAADGKWRRVVATTNHPYSGKIVKVTGCGDGIGAWITEEHRIFGSTDVGITRLGKDRVYASSDTPIKTPDWHRAWDYSVGDILAYPRPKMIGDLPEFLPTGDARLWRFLGYWCGDGGAPSTKTGNYPIKIHLGSSKSFFADDAIECMEHVLVRKSRTEMSPSRENSIDLVVSSCKEWWERLRNFVGMSDERGLPLEWLEAASDDDLRNFMIGLLRTDGGPTFRPDGILSKWVWTGTSQHLASNVMYCTSRLGIPAYVCSRESTRYDTPTKPRWDIHIRWDYAKTLLLDEDVSGMLLPSKAFKSKQWCDESLWYSVVTKIEEDYYEGTVYDLQVEGDPSFGCLQRLMLHNCQNDPNADTTFKAAMQMSMSEPEHIIVLLSTFHHPVGLFQEIWDNAEQKGFRRYEWDVFDVMTRCDAGLDRATSEDPKAQEFCRNECPLTTCEPIYDEHDQFVGNRYVGCDGRARKSTGFLPRENVINAMVLNEGSEIFRVEFACQRPMFSGPIYGLEAIENAMVDEMTIDDTERTIVGIDWGVTEGVLIVGKDSFNGGPQILESRYLSVKLVGEYIKILSEWQEEYGHLEVYADSSHPFEIGDLEQAGFDVVPVDFATMKDYGIANLLKMFMYGKIRILDDNTRLVDQLKSYRKDPKTGKPLKINDHGPDALLCLTITIDFTERWAELITARANGLARTKLLKTIDDLGLDKKPDDSEVDENTVDRDNSVMLF